MVPLTCHSDRPKEKKCSKCGEIKPRSEFGRHAKEKWGIRPACKACYREQRSTRGETPSTWAGHLRLKYAMRVCHYENLSVQQGGVCAICRSACATGKRLAVDHAHDTGKIRGLLCMGCNTSLGKLKDSPTVLASALRYLHAHGKALSTEEMAELVGLHQ